MADVFSSRVTGDLDAALDQFASRLTAEVARPGAQAMAQVVYESARELVPVHSGLLREAIYQSFSPDNSKDGRAVYHVSWNKKKAPHGQLIEFGTSRSVAEPFLYPAYSTNKDRLLAAANAAMRAAMKA